MDEIPENVYLQFNPNQLKLVRKEVNYDDISRLLQDINQLEDWIRKQNHFIVKEYERSYLERYLIYSKGQIERAKKHFDKLCTLRGLMPDHLLNFDIKNEFKDLFKTFYTCTLPKPTTDNYRVLFAHVHTAENYESLHLIHYSRYWTVLLEYLYCHDYNVGVEIVTDLSNFSINIISRLNPIIVSNIAMLLFEARGLRLKGVHLLTGSKMVDVVITMVKQALTKKLQSRVYVHQDLDSLYKFVPKEILPKEYGGKEAPLKELHEKNFEALCSEEHIKWMKFLDSAITDESKRLRCEFNDSYSGMPGSFKVLNVD